MTSRRHDPGSARPAPGVTAPKPTPTDAAPAARTARNALRLGALALVVSALGLALAVVAVVGPARGSCRTTAWNVVPAAADLPEEWTLGTSQVTAEGLAASLIGPAPADDPSGAPTIYTMVSCFDGDAATAFERSRSAAEAAGMVTVDRPDLADTGFAIQDTSAVTQAIYFRRGGLVAYLTPSGTVDDATLDTAAGALVAAVDRAVAGVTPVPATAAPSEPATSEEPSPSGGASAIPEESTSPAPSSAATELQAMLPAAVSGSALTSDTATGADLGETGAAGRAMIAALGTKDIAAEDLLVAQAYDTNGELDLYLIGFQAPGTPAADLAPIVLDTWLSASTSGVTTSTVTLGGKELTKVSYGDGGAVSYVRATPGEAVFVIETSDETLAAAAAALLP